MAQQNSFYTHNTLYIDGQKFEGGQWTIAWETPGLVSRVRAGLLKTAKPVEQVDNHVAPPVVTMQTTPQIPVERVAVQTKAPVLDAAVHPAFAPVVRIEEPVVVEEAVVEEEAASENVEENIQITELPVVEATDVKTPVKRKAPKA